MVKPEEAQQNVRDLVRFILQVCCCAHEAAQLVRFCLACDNPLLYAGSRIWRRTGRQVSHKSFHIRHIAQPAQLTTTLHADLLVWMAWTTGSSTL